MVDRHVHLLFAGGHLGYFLFAARNSRPGADVAAHRGRGIVESAQFLIGHEDCSDEHRVPGDFFCAALLTAAQAGHGLLLVICS